MDIKRQLHVIQNILNATDEEIRDEVFLLNQIKEYGITALNWWREIDDSYYYTANGMIQTPWEFAHFCKMISDYKISTAIEVGVYRGRSSYFICAILYRKNKNLIYDMVDVADYLDEYDEFARILPCLRKNIPNTSFDFKGKSYDFVFIDADHSYDASMQDYMNVGRYAKKLLCFHDVYAREDDYLDGGIGRTWKEVCILTPNIPKITYSQFPERWMGIGVCVNDGMLQKNIGTESDVEMAKQEASRFEKGIKTVDKLWVYGTRNDSRRMYDACKKRKYPVSGLVVTDLSEVREEMEDYPIFRMKDVVDYEKDGVILSWRKQLQSEQLQKLKENGLKHIFVTDDKTATFMG